MPFFNLFCYKCEALTVSVYVYRTLYRKFIDFFVWSVKWTLQYEIYILVKNKYRSNGNDYAKNKIVMAEIFFSLFLSVAQFTINYNRGHQIQSCYGSFSPSAV